jgi:Uma2 family endonuclease
LEISRINYIFATKYLVMDYHENVISISTNIASEYEAERNKTTPSFNHSMVQGNLITELNNQYRTKYSFASELSLELADWPSVPDISILPKAKLDFQNDQIRVYEAPLCAIEIISPSQSLNELTDKAREYFNHGVKSCWLVMLPLTSICVFSSPSTYEIFRSNQTLKDTVLDINLPLKEVFE